MQVPEEVTALFSGTKNSNSGDPASPKSAGGLWPLVTLVGVLAGGTGVVANAFSLSEWRDTRAEYQGDKYDESLCFTRDIAMHCFAFILCFLVMGAELEISFLITHFEFLKNWFGRGLFYAFVGAMTYDVDLNDKEYGDLGFDKVAALGLMALGGFYIVIAFLLDYSPAILSGLINLQGLPQRPDYDL